MLHRIKQSSIGFRVGLFGAMAGAIAAIAYIATDIGDRTFSWLVVALVFVGAALFVGNLFIKFPLLPLLASFCFSAATAYSVYLMLPTLSDIWNNVNFIGGNPVQAVVFTSLFFLCDVTTMIACFTK